MSHALSELVEEVRRDARDIAPGCVRPVPAVTCAPVPDRSGAKLAEEPKGRCSSHGGHRCGEDREDDYQETFADAPLREHPGLDCVAGVAGTSRSEAASDGH